MVQKSCKFSDVCGIDHLFGYCLGQYKIYGCKGQRIDPNINNIGSFNILASSNIVPIQYTRFPKPLKYVRLIIHFTTMWASLLLFLLIFINLITRLTQYLG